MNAAPATPSAQPATTAPALAQQARERWKYSRLEQFRSALEQTAGSSPIAVAKGLEQNNQPFAAEVVESLHPPAQVYPLLADVHDAAQGASWLTVARDTHACLVLDRPAGANVLYLDVGPGAVLELNQSLAADGPSHQCIYIRAGANSRLRIESAIIDQPHLSFSFIGCDLGEGARLDSHRYLFGGGQHRVESRVRLTGSLAHAELTSACLAAAGGQFDQQVTLEHVAPQATSNQRFHCVADASCRSTFNGRILIHPKAPGTRADLTNRNLMLAESAEINAKPELEIYTDDVQCSHGSTVGQLDDDALFYLKSRGIAGAQARKLLITAFLERCLDGAGADTARAALQRHLNAGHGETS
ncbi:MAG: SufD family Fe-S cluster assembly protein [Pseudomonadota bacterium]